MNSNFLLCFTGGRGHDRFVSVQMPGGDAILPIGVAGIEAARQQNLILTKEKQVNCDGECGALSHGCYTGCVRLRFPAMSGRIWSANVSADGRFLFLS